MESANGANVGEKKVSLEGVGLSRVTELNIKKVGRNGEQVMSCPSIKMDFSENFTNSMLKSP